MGWKMERVVNKLTKKNKTISTMESCTGGYIASSITNIPGASEIIKFGAVTYSNEYKIKMGVNKNTIDKYSVYSMEVAKEMSKSISDFANSDYGIGVTGKINREDKENPYGKDNLAYVSMYEREKDEYYTLEVYMEDKTRLENKELILKNIVDKLLEII